MCGCVWPENLAALQKTFLDVDPPMTKPGRSPAKNADMCASCADRRIMKMPEFNNATDPFNPLSLRIDPAMGAALGVKKALVHVSVRKPSRQEYFRTHPDPDYRMIMAILELKEERETYLVAPEIAATFPGEVRVVELRVCITRTGTLFLWAVPLPTPDGRENAWHKTARDAANLAETRWIRVVANMSAGCYDVFEAPPGLSEPDWPEHSLSELLRVGFGANRLINTVDHPILKRLRGL